MANKNTKAASRKAAAKQNPQVPAEQPADIVPEQPQADPEPDGSEAPEVTPASTEQPADIVPEQQQADPEPDGSEAPELVPASTEQPAPEQVPAEPSAQPKKEAPAKSAARGSGKAPAAKAKTIRDTSAQAVAKQVFKSHPDKQTVYVASDGTPFFVKCDADNYGRTLDDKLVVAVTNENYKA